MRKPVPSRQKLFMPYLNNKKSDQPALTAYPCSLISVLLFAAWIAAVDMK